MSLLDTLWGGAKALIQGAVSVAREVVRAVFEEIDRSPFGKAATEIIKGVSRQYFGRAQDLVDEERELADKRAKDGRLREADLEQLRAIQAKRDEWRKELEAAKAAEVAKELREVSEDLIAANLSADEAASAVGILASKTCECGGTMRIVQGASTTSGASRSFIGNAPCLVPSLARQSSLTPKQIRRRYSVNRIPTWTVPTPRVALSRSDKMCWPRRTAVCAKGWAMTMRQ